MSKYGMEELKDLKVSKKRVMTNVVKHLEQRESPKSSRRLQYNLLTLIFTACIGIFLYDQYNEKNLVGSDNVQILNEEDISMYLQLARDSSKEFLNGVLQTRIEIDAYYVYALSKGIVLSKATIVEQEKLTKEQFENISKDSKFIEDLAKLKVTPDVFYEEYMEPDIIKFVAHKELLKEYFKKNKNSFQLHARVAVKKEAMAYFTSKYNQKIEYLEKKYQLSSNPTDVNSFIKQYKYGYIVAVEGDRFLVVSGELDGISHLSYTEIIEKKQNGVWFPLNGLEDKIAIGKQVNITYSIKDETISNGYDYAANLDEIEIIE